MIKSFLAVAAASCIISGDLDRSCADESHSNAFADGLDTVVSTVSTYSPELFGPFDSTVFTESFFALRHFNSTPAQGLNIIIK